MTERLRTIVIVVSIDTNKRTIERKFSAGYSSIDLDETGAVVESVDDLIKRVASSVRGIVEGVE